jgi:RNA polymerase sigma-70 factor (ECF subfamily)
VQEEPAAGLAERVVRNLAGSVRGVELVPASLSTWMTAAQPAPEPAQALPVESAPQEGAAASASSRLVRQALAGDSTAFGHLIDLYERASLAVAYATTRDAAAAADAVQEACLKAWHKRHSLADPERFAGWLMHIVRRCALDQLRTRKPIMALEGVQEPARTEDAAAGLMRRETDECVRQALDELDDESRLAVVMRYYDNAPAREIADLLGCSPAAVDMRLKRARDKLRERLSSLKSPESTRE